MEAPDFRCKGPGIDFCVEATTVGPSTSGVLAEHPNPKTPEERLAFLENYMPMKFGSALSAKLNKTNAAGLHYWEMEEARNKPFAIAIADFHGTQAQFESSTMTFTNLRFGNICMEAASIGNLKERI